MLLPYVTLEERAYMFDISPTQNSYIERVNGTYRRAVLDAYIFRNLDEAKSITEKWMKYYNTERPHVSLGNMTPQEYTAMQS